MLKTFKKSIALFVALVFVLSMVPFGVMAEAEPEKETAKIYFTNYSYTRHSGNSYLNDPGTFGVNGETHNIRFGGQYYGYVQLDLTGYEEILANEGTTIKVTVVGGPYTTTQRSCGDFKAYLVNDVADGSYKSKVTTKKQADDLNMHDTTRPVLFAKSDGVTLKSSQNGGQPGTYEADIDALVSCLNEGSDNSLVTLYLVPTGTVNPSYINPKISYLEISYNADEVNNQSYVNDITSGITLDKITDDDVTNITKDLPTFYKGATISWEASVPGMVSSNGEITPPLGTATDVTLTATFTYKDATATATFDATIAPEQAIEVKIHFTNYAYSRSSAKGNADAKNTIYKRQTHEETTVQSIVTGGSYDAYTQLDLKGYEEILKNPHTSIQMKLTAGFRYSSARIHNLEGVLAPDRADSYNWETVTWNIADDIGLHETEGRPVLFTKNDDVRTSNGTTITLDANKEALLSALSENDTNSIVSIHFDPLDWNGEVVSDQNYSDSTIRANNDNTCLVITYYESEIDNDEFFADIESTFAWDAITSDAQEAVVNDLPNYYKGADIVWSSAEGYVTSSGELAIPSDSAMVDDTITANVSYNGNTFTREFTVKLCDGSLTLGAPSLTLEGGVATGSVEVTNATGADVKYDLYIAVYSDGEMVNLVPLEFTATKGALSSKELDAKDVPTGAKVKFLVWEYGKTTPATVAVEK